MRTLTIDAAALERVKITTAEELRVAELDLERLRADLASAEAAVALADSTDALAFRRARDKTKSQVERVEQQIARHRLLAEGLDEKLREARANEAARQYAAEAKARAEKEQRVGTKLQATLKPCAELAELMAQIFGEDVINKKYFPKGLTDLSKALVWLENTVADWQKK